MSSYKLLDDLYKSFVKPILFKIDPEDIHDLLSFGSYFVTKNLNFTPKVKTFDFSSNVNGLEFQNVVGLAAGFDYDANWVKSMPFFGFGFNTVGTVTNMPYKGNPKPRLTRLIDSNSILVNKGFKSSGADFIRKRLLDFNLDEQNIGVSIGASNNPSLDSVEKSINDICTSLEKFTDLDFVKYFELNISCPNIVSKDSFYTFENYKKLLLAIKPLNIRRPIFVKMPIDFELETLKRYISFSLEKNINTFIFSNLQKDRAAVISKKDSEKIKNLKGNLSGGPSFNQSNMVIASAKKEFSKNINIIGCGGILSPQDAWQKIKLGANLVQLVTGFIFSGPFLPIEINTYISDKLRQTGMCFEDAVGIDADEFLKDNLVTH